MFPECSLNVPWMFPECSLNVPWMFPECSLKVHWKFTESSLKVHWKFTESLLKVYWKFIDFSLSFHWLFTDFSLTFHCIHFPTAGHLFWGSKNSSCKAAPINRQSRLIVSCVGTFVSFLQEDWDRRNAIGREGLPVDYRMSTKQTVGVVRSPTHRIWVVRRVQGKWCFLADMRITFDQELTLKELYCWSSHIFPC
jgi:hypothetical protein